MFFDILLYVLTVALNMFFIVLFSFFIYLLMLKLFYRFNKNYFKDNFIGDYMFFDSLLKFFDYRKIKKIKNNLVIKDLEVVQDEKDSDDVNIDYIDFSFWK